MQIVKPDNIGFYFKPDTLCSDEEFEGIPKRKCCISYSYITSRQNNLQCTITSFCIAVFDFGLVKELKPSLRKSQSICHHSTTENDYTDEDALFKLTGRTGSRRYMSPEV